MAFTVSMEQPSTHVYQVVFRCDGFKGATQDFKMPVWSPGYYGVFDFAKNVQNFRAEDGNGKPLKWEKTTENTWRVQSDQAAAITVTYDVLATSRFVGNSYLDDSWGYIVPAGVFLHVGGQIQHPVTVTIVPNPKWSTIATGLDPVSADKPHTFAAPDFDILYDSPILMGNLESLPPFEIQGVPHYFIGYNPGVSDREQFMKDLKAVISVQSYRDRLNLHPHMHALANSGVWYSDGSFEAIPSIDTRQLMLLFRHHVLKNLLACGKIGQATLDILDRFHHPGFSAYQGKSVSPGDRCRPGRPRLLHRARALLFGPAAL